MLNAISRSASLAFISITLGLFAAASARAEVSIDAMTEQFTDLGYVVTEVEDQGTVVEFKMTTPGGRIFEAKVNAGSGALITFTEEDGTTIQHGSLAPKHNKTSLTKSNRGNHYGQSKVHGEDDAEGVESADSGGGHGGGNGGGHGGGNGGGHGGGNGGGHGGGNSGSHGGDDD